MPGLFDDLIPTAASGTEAVRPGGLFDDLVPVAQPADGARAAAEYQGEPETWGEYGSGLSRAAGQGLTLGFGDELEAAVRAPFSDRTYSEIRDDVRGQNDQFTERHPYQAAAAELAGGLVIPGASAKTALKAGQTVANFTRTGRVGQLAASGVIAGAPTGAVYGAGKSEGETLGEVGQDAAVGGAIGGAAGGVLQPVGAGVILAAEKGAKLTADALRKLTGGSIKGNLAPAAAARDRVQRALAEDAEIAGVTGNPLVSEAEMAAAAQRGQPVALLDMGGSTTRGVARSSANSSGAAREMLESVTDKRFASQGERTADFLRQLGSGQTAQVSREALRNEARQIREPLYKAAYKTGNSGIDDKALQQLETAPAMKKALSEARDRIANRHAVEGATGNLEQRIVGKKGYTLEYYDAAKQALDDRITTLLGKGQNGEAREYIAVRDKLTNILDDHVPEYSNARGAANQLFDAGDALTAGERFATNAGRYETAQVRDALTKYSTREQELFREGFTSRLTERATELGDRRNIANELANSTASRERITMVLGPQKAKELEAQLRLEAVMELGHKAVSGNSTTARQLVELGLIGGAGTYGAYSNDPYALTVAGLLAGRRGAISLAERRTALEVAKLLTSGDPAKLRQAAAKVASSGQLPMLRALDKQLENAGVWRTLATQRAVSGQEERKKKDPLVNALRSINKR